MKTLPRRLNDAEAIRNEFFLGDASFRSRDTSDSFKFIVENSIDRPVSREKIRQIVRFGPFHFQSILVKFS